MAAALRSLDEAGGVDEDGAGSAAEWVKANTRRSGREAARLARRATELPDLPGTRTGLADGTLTPEAADAVVSAVRDGRLGDGREVEEALLPVATSRRPEQLRSEIRRRQQQADADALLRDELEQHARRRASFARRASGGWDLRAFVADEVGTTLRTAFEAFDRPGPGADGRGDPRRPDQRLADALAAIVDAVLDGGATPGHGGIGRPHLSVLVDADTLAADLGPDPEQTVDDPTSPTDAPPPGPRPDDDVWAGLAPGDLPWGGELSPQAVRRLACDAVLTRVVMRAPSQVLDVGRATRSWSEPQRRAVNARDRQCRGPECSRPIGWTNVHHVRWWERDLGHTDVDNGLALCHHCHHLVHDRGWTVELNPATAVATWRSPTGPPRAGPARAEPAPTTIADARCDGRDGPDGWRQVHGDATPGHGTVARRATSPPSQPDPAPRGADHTGMALPGLAGPTPPVRAGPRR